MDIRTFSSAIRLRIALRFLTIFSNTMVMPYVVVFFVEQVGAKTATWMTICTGISGINGYLIGGKMADQYGRKKLILIGEFLTGAGFIIVAIGNMPVDSNPYISLIGFIIIFLFSSMASPAYSGFVIDETTKGNRKNVYTALKWTAYLSFALGSLTGGFLFNQFATILFVVVACSSFLSFACVLIWIEDKYRSTLERTVTPEIKGKTKHSTLKVYRVMLRDPVFISLAYVTLTVALMDEQLSYYLSIRYVSLFEAEGYTILGFLRTENTLLAVGLTIFITRFLKKMSDINALITESMIFFIGYILLSISEISNILFLGMAIVTIGEIIFIPSTQAITAEIIPDEFRSTYSGVLGVVSTVGGLLASLFILLTDYFPPVGFTIIYTGIGMFTLMVVLNLKKTNKIEVQ
ncbi:MFS transporter [Psychrobacillus glaciei]|uniref:MFS transporter n=1 Tax=Psychrobacillus glaciei TaxID=2283160 RepID=A0A5J6SP61_9BACI|nr:MFS transporter [Psychrobacillus glaciei]QFF99273.1 MFS transporter [Psychrobacillus glaciei]